MLSRSAGIWCCASSTTCVSSSIRPIRVVGSWLIWHGGWQRREIITAVELLSAAGRLSRDTVFVDVGAHIGTHTVYALRTGRFARAVAFEPAPRNARLLAMNLELNGLAGTAVGRIRKAAGADHRYGGAASASAQQRSTFDRLAAIGRRPRSAPACRSCG